MKVDLCVNKEDTTEFRIEISFRHAYSFSLSGHKSETMLDLKVLFCVLCT